MPRTSIDDPPSVPIGEVFRMPTARRRRLVTGRPIAEPDPTFTRRREMPGGNVVCPTMTRTLLIGDRCGDRSRSAPDLNVDASLGSSPGAAHGPKTVRVADRGCELAAAVVPIFVPLTIVLPVVSASTLFRVILVPVCQGDI